MVALVVYDPATKKTWTAINHFHFPNGICVSHDGRSVLIASTTLCQVFRYWIEGPKRAARAPDRAPPGVRRQYQPGVRRQLLGCSGGHPLAGLRSGDAQARIPAAHGQAGADRRVVAPVSTMAASSNSRCRRSAEVLLGSDRGQSLHPDLDARAQGLSLSWRAGEQPCRPDQAEGRGDPTWSGFEAYWGNKRRKARAWGSLRIFGATWSRSCFPRGSSMQSPRWMARSVQMIGWMLATPIGEPSRRR